ncbi:hypothetical protein ZTR_10761 [Talaromyces verruculosus]|nr:hypothetical protein ZTR_10761 [Talaromyces verruculosus]
MIRLAVILDLLDYTYANTGRVEPAGKSQLRDLVIHYVAFKPLFEPDRQTHSIPHFTFLVGDEKVPLTVHTAAVENLSAPLYALINNGSTKESQTKTATLEDVEASTFISFCEFVYTGQYATPTRKETGMTKQDLNAERQQLRKQPEEVLDECSGFAPIRKKKQPKRSNFFGNSDDDWQSPKEKRDDNDFFTKFWENFLSQKFDSGLARLSSQPDIIFHAKSYIFATKYLIEPLRQQSLATLHHDLLILDLLDFVYTNTGRSEPSGKSLIRDLVIHYVSCKMRILSDSEDFFAILDSDAEMGSDLKSSNPIWLIQSVPVEILALFLFGTAVVTCCTSEPHATKALSRVFKSPQFTFLVGEKETPLTIHAAVLEGLSGPLNAMVNNGMKESISRAAVLKDVEVEVFVAFCEFAYAGRYEITRANLMNRDIETDQEMAVDKSDGCSKDNHREVERKYHKLREWEGDGLELHLSWPDFTNRQFGKDKRWGQCAKPEFDFQLKIYFFATRYLIEPLRQRCLFCLSIELSRFKLSRDNSKDIFDMLEFLYLSPDVREPTSKSCIRDLIVHYVACKFTILSESERYAGLLDSSAEFTRDLLMAMKKWRSSR